MAAADFFPMFGEFSDIEMEYAQRCFKVALQQSMALCTDKDVFVISDVVVERSFTLVEESNDEDDRRLNGRALRSQPRRLQQVSRGYLLFNFTMYHNGRNALGARMRYMEFSRWFDSCLKLPKPPNAMPILGKTLVLIDPNEPFITKNLDVCDQQMCRNIARNGCDEEDRNLLVEGAWLRSCDSEIYGPADCSPHIDCQCMCIGGCELPKGCDN